MAIGAAVAGFQMVTQAARSWVNSGLAGTGIGNQMSMQFTLLSQQIAGVFVPTLNLVIRGIETLTAWFRSLTGEQQNTIRRWVEAAAVMVVVSQVAGRLGSAFMGLVGTIITGTISAAGTMLATVLPAISALVTAVVTGSGIAGAALNLAFAGIPLIVGLIGAVVSALASLGIAGATVGTGIAVGTKSGRAALATLWEGIKPLIDSFRRLTDEIKTLMGPALENVGGSVGRLLARVATVIDGMLQRTGPALAKLAEWLSKLGKEISAWLDGITTQDIERWIQTAIDKFNEWKPVMKEIADLAVQIGSNITTAMTAATVAMQLFGVSAKGIGVELKAINLVLQATNPLGFIKPFKSLYDGLFGEQKVGNISVMGKKPGDDKKTGVSAVGGQFEQAQDLFKRINEAAIKSEGQRTNELLASIDNKITPIPPVTNMPTVYTGSVGTVTVNPKIPNPG
jgi:hypothetical protein